MEGGRLEGAIALPVHSAPSKVTDGEGNTTETSERDTTRLHQVDNAKKLEELKTVVEKQGQTINGLLTWAFTLANYYCVSQAVVFNALPGNKYIEVYTSRDRNNRHRAALMGASSSPEGEPNHKPQLIEKDPALEKWLKTYFYACIIAFAFLAIVIAFGSVWILCLEKIIVKHHDHDDDGAKCLKLCDGGKCIRICPES
ncbi:hypothetical protein RHSIM_RhsimUnG0088800 [Rhododendron simsii]|uniref:4Fe-4S ferredoxin-type domain-containing protein n=1 Tax=Rhododendron simsii TaxID=118357 RepID=A0A834FV43_RHOSS|nr:hypothetical protein RHSIM_RhsimUnG0088800 [Rhododendron simsii]